MQQYQNYKDSKIPWLGEIPVEWNVVKLNHITPIITCGVASTPEYVDSGVPFLSAQNVKKGKVDLSKGYKFITPEFHKELTKNRKPQNGDILLTRVGTIGEICIVDVDFEFSVFVSLTHLRVDQQYCINKFFKYLFESKYIKELNYAVTLTGAGVGNLNVNDLREYRIPLPSICEQKVIIKYLDDEIFKINSLIDEKNNFIELLKEKRQALISHVVTKGLDPNVEMKDSGIDWIGEVPEHWVIIKLKQCIDDISSGKSLNAIDIPAESNEVGILKTSCVYNNAFNYNENKQVIHEEISLASCPVEKDRLIVSRMNTPELVGAVGLTYDNYPNIFLPDRLWQIKIKENFNPQYIYYSMLSDIYRLQVKFKCSGTSASMQNLSQDGFKSILTTAPTLEEQNGICSYILSETTKIDNLIGQVTETVLLLQEHRTALISAAVTGKIDVRDYMKNNKNNEE